MFLRNLRLVAAATVGLLLLSGNASATTIYTFVDEQGVVHLTNVPSDSRYQPTTRFSFPEVRGRGAKAPAGTFEPFIREAGRRFAVDPMLVKAVIKVESDFDHRALSSKGAMGLMQLMPETASDMHVNDPFDPKSNIMGGTRYLGLLLGQFGGDLLLALAAYNAGPTRVVLAQNTIPPFPETIEYVKKVLRHYKRYRTSAVSSGDRWMKAMAY